MNEKVVNFLMMVVIVGGVLLLMNMCNGGNKNSTPPAVHKDVEWAAPAGMAPPVKAAVPTTAPAGEGAAPASATAPAAGGPKAETRPETSTAPAGTTPATNPTTAPATGPASPAPAPPAAWVERHYTLGNATDPKSPYRLAVTVTSLEAGVEKVELNVGQHAQTPERKQPLTLFEAAPNTVKPFGVLDVRLGGFGPKPIAYPGTRYAIWEVVRGESDASGVANRLTLRQPLLLPGGKVAATVYRTYALEPGSYDVGVTTRVENLSGQEITVTVDQLTTVGLPNDSFQYDARYVQTANFIDHAGKGRVDASSGQLMHAAAVKQAFSAGGVTGLGAFAPGGNHVLWTAQANRFFTAIVRPLPQQNPAAPSAGTMLPLETGDVVPAIDWLKDAAAYPLTVGTPVDQSPVGVRWAGADVKVAAGQSVDLPARAYLGPKDPKGLAGNKAGGPGAEEYAKAVMGYANIIHYSQGGPCGWCTFDWLIIPIIKLLEFFYAIVHNYGVSILILTLFVRLLLHPLTRMGQVQMAVMQKKMAAIQPELERVKRRYEKDKKTQQMEIMKVYRENNVNPAGGLMGCLPMMLQTPIWLALFAGLATDIALRHAPFISGWINDLSNPDTVAKIPLSFHLPVLGITEGAAHWLPVNILPILLGVLFFVQMKLNMSASPKPADPQQAQTQKISQYMILLFPLFLYHAPSGLNLYMVASTTGGMFDTWLIRKSLRAKGILPAAMTSPM